MMKILKKMVKTTFGMMLDLDMPSRGSDRDVVILCVNDGRGLMPVHLCLPHQVYESEVRELWAKYNLDKTSFGEIVAVPARSNEYITIAKGEKSA
jgi:hypothetical protein